MWAKNDGEFHSAKNDVDPSVLPVIMHEHTFQSREHGDRLDLLRSNCCPRGISIL